MRPASQRMAAVRSTGVVREHVAEMLAEETPVVVAYNLVPYAVMMLSPRDLEDFAVGFSVTEGVVGSAAEVSRVTVAELARGIELQLEIPVERAEAIAGRGHAIAGRTGCGICGATELDQVLRAVPQVEGDERVSAEAVSAAMASLSLRQPLNDETGAVHAAGWASFDGSLTDVREDVGRHNALDKLGGALLRRGARTAGGFVVLTSRGSYELVQKAAVIGAPLVATVSAPTAMAVRVASECGITLVGFAREGRLTLYTGAHRLA